MYLIKKRSIGLGKAPAYYHGEGGGINKPVVFDRPVIYQPPPEGDIIGYDPDIITPPMRPDTPPPIIINDIPKWQQKRHLIDADKGVAVPLTQTGARVPPSLLEPRADFHWVRIFDSSYDFGSYWKWEAIAAGFNNEPNIYLPPTGDIVRHDIESGLFISEQPKVIRWGKSIAPDYYNIASGEVRKGQLVTVAGQQFSKAPGSGSWILYGQAVSQGYVSATGDAGTSAKGEFIEDLYEKEISGITAPQPPAGGMPPVVDSAGFSGNTMLLVGAGLLAFFLFKGK